MSYVLFVLIIYILFVIVHFRSSHFDLLKLAGWKLICWLHILQWSPNNFFNTYSLPFWSLEHTRFKVKQVQGLPTCWVRSLPCNVFSNAYIDGRTACGESCVEQQHNKCFRTPRCSVALLHKGTGQKYYFQIGFISPWWDPMMKMREALLLYYYGNRGCQVLQNLVVGSASITLNPFLQLWVILQTFGAFNAESFKSFRFEWIAFSCQKHIYVVFVLQALKYAAGDPITEQKAMERRSYRLPVSLLSCSKIIYIDSFQLMSNMSVRPLSCTILHFKLLKRFLKRDIFRISSTMAVWNLGKNAISLINTANVL